MNPSYIFPSIVFSRMSDTITLYISHEAKPANCLGLSIITSFIVLMKAAYFIFVAFSDKSESSLQMW